MPKIQDVSVTACNMIRSIRKQASLLRRKTIAFDGIRLDISVHPKTGNISLVHSLRAGKSYVYPTKHQHLKCINQHAIDMVIHNRRLRRLNGGLKL